MKKQFAALLLVLCFMLAGCGVNSSEAAGSSMASADTSSSISKETSSMESTPSAKPDASTEEPSSQDKPAASGTSSGNSSSVPSQRAAAPTENASASASKGNTSSNTSPSTSSNAANPSNTPSTSGTTAGSSSTVSKPPSTSSATASGTSSGAVVETVKVTFPEGTTVARMSDLLSAKGVTDSDSFFEAIASMDVSTYPLAAAVQTSGQRCFRLEGYLFPDTYEFYVGEGAQKALGRMLQNGEKRISQSYRDRAAELGMTMDQAITLASIIQKEASTAQMGTVSSVLHNRLNAGMRLQCDVTIKYVEGALKPYISGDINRFNASYNTYKCAALPAGAICNPGIAALKAALWPEDTSYLYFAFDSAGNYYYSDTFEEHVQKCKDAGISTGNE